MNSYPPAIANFHHTLYKLKGISTIESGVDDLELIDTEMLSLSAYAHLPHASLQRTRGGLDNEVLIQFDFTLDNSAESLQSLEFIAWFIRDCARGGTKIQLRPFALPPETPYGRQLGTKLKFHIDVFVEGIEETLDPAFQVIDDLNHSLELAMHLYQIPVK